MAPQLAESSQLLEAWTGAPRALYLDCFSGAAGNMLLGALFQLGVPQSAVLDAIGALGVKGVEMQVSSVKRGAFQATYVSFDAPDRSAEERRFATIRALIDAADLAPRLRERSQRVFRALALAEGRVHGIDPARVHFHEVGGLDAICDIVGCCAALEWLGVDHVTASPLPLGTGTVETAHGRLPLPAPATVELLRGIPTVPAGIEWETVTPTGAALLRELASDYGPMPAMTPIGQGFGAGNEREGPLPNILRAILGASETETSTPEAGLLADRVVQLETNLDDMNPEHLPYLIDRLMEDGALDAALTPLAMKKGRPGQLLRVLARPLDRDRLARRILLESSALGVRFQEMPRLMLRRDTVVVDTAYGPIAVKVARSPDGHSTLHAEYEDCARAAQDARVPIDEVYRAAENAARVGRR
jgi:uncharacterized protein (TIGR00299 family) protein